MDAKPVQRRLAAVLAADVAGYTRMMQTDEDATMASWYASRNEVIDPKIAEHKGRIVKLTGDGFLAEFPTVQDAVRCAVDMQTELVGRNSDVPDDRRMDFRMGVNLGDIIVDSEDIYGDGVNIAARLESLAEPGAVCISAAVYDQVKNKLALDYTSLGAQKLKNIAEPLQVYQIGVAAAPRAESEERGEAEASDSVEPQFYQWTGYAAGLIVVLGIAVMVWNYYSN